MIVLKKIKPMFTSIVTTMDMYKADIIGAGGIIDVSKSKGSLMEYQKVIAIGTSVREIKVGDLVCINPTNYGVKKHQEGGMRDGIITDNPVIKYNFKTINIDGIEYLYLQDRDIEYIVEEYDNVEDPLPSKIIQPKSKLILS